MAFVLSTSEDEDFVVTNSLYLHSLEVVITAVLYNPALALAILDGHEWTQQFFAAWFKHLPKLTRVHDKKMTITAICALLEWLSTVGVGAPLAQNASQLVVGALQVFRDLPAALASQLPALVEFVSRTDVSALPQTKRSRSATLPSEGARRKTRTRSSTLAKTTTRMSVSRLNDER